MFNLVTGFGPVVGEALVKHPEVDMISFTGSTRAGKRISEIAAQTVKRVTLELGGKSASVILDDADLAAAVKGTVSNCYLNSGQTCTAFTRMLVPESKYAEAKAIAAEVAKAFAPGDPMAETTRLGPLSSQMQLERVRGYIKKGIEEGAELVAGGAEAPEGVPPGGYFVKPTVFGKVDPKSTIGQEEIFGPVLSIITYKDEEDAIRIANDTIYGLAGRRLVEGRSARAESGAPHARRADRHQRRAVQHERAVRRLQAVGPRPRSRQVRAGGISRVQIAAAESLSQAGKSDERQTAF